MKLFDEDTNQSHDADVLKRAPDVPVRVDTAMRRRAAEYQGPPTPDDVDGLLWWDKVKLLTAHS